MKLQCGTTLLISLFTMEKNVIPANYHLTLNALKERIRQAQFLALKAVNKELIELYWHIGKTITEQQEKEKWGSGVVEQLAKDLQVEFPGVRGFSFRNLWNMRNYYMSYKENRKLQTLSAEITWSHSIMILERCKDKLHKEFYIKSTIREGWSVRTLEDKIRFQEYEKWAFQQTNFDNNLEKNLALKAQNVVKDDYNLDFLLLNNDHTEKQLEEALLENIIKLLSELGGDFCFVGRQYRVEIDNEEFFIDLLFYHRELKSLIAIELKADKFMPEYSGKMGFYLAALDDKEKKPDENPSIGIIVCKQKNRTIVEYALKDIHRPIGVATYSYKDLPSKLAKFLPSEAEIEKRLG